MGARIEERHTGEAAHIGYKANIGTQERTGVWVLNLSPVGFHAKKQGMVGASVFFGLPGSGTVHRTHSEN
jgi:hypothetical protein